MFLGGFFEGFGRFLVRFWRGFLDMFERLSPGTPHSIGRAHAWIFDDFRKLFERVLTILARSSPVNRSCPRLDIQRNRTRATSTKNAPVGKSQILDFVSSSFVS